MSPSLSVARMEPERTNPRISRGQVIALFAFDVGFEVSFEELDRLLTSRPLPPLSQKKQTPPYLQYSKPPRTMNLGQIDPLFTAPGNIRAMMFDFGVASIAYHWIIGADTASLPLQQLPQVAQDLYNRNLEMDARSRARQLMETIRPAITRPELSALVEDYYLFIIEELDQPWPSEDLLAKHGSTLAQVLRFEVQPLSQEQQEEALAQRMAYYQDDLVLVDWNAAIIYDRDSWDAANVLELLNVELLEARYIDAELDRRITEYQRLMQKPIKWALPFQTPYRKTMQELAELRIESLVLAKRVENALKLIGDLYLARLHNAATARFYLPDWEAAISRKLDIIANFYQITNDRVRTAQSHILELVVIALIFLEILLAILK